MNYPRELFSIHRRGKQPLYDLIEQNFRDLISTGQLKPEAAVPPEFELAGLYNVSRLTVRRALDELARQGWIKRRHGVGTFIANPTVTQISPSKLSFTEQMHAIGRQARSRMISSRVIPAEALVANTLHLQPGAPVIEIKRVRLADGEPVLLETSYLSQQRFAGLENDRGLEETSLYETLSSRYQTSVATMDQILEPVLLTKGEAKLLETEAGAPAIKSEVTAFTSNHDPIEYSCSVTRGDKCKFYFSFRRGENSEADR
jgi:GntR family transcriptional regulator